MTLRLEYRDETSQKFWEPKVEGNGLVVQFGKIGATGQQHSKKFSSPQKATDEFNRLVREKLSKGYRPTAESRTLLVSDESVTSPEALYSVSLREHTPPEVLEDICVLLTALVKSGMTIKQFEKLCEKLQDDALSSVVCFTSGVSDDDSGYWEDNGLDVDELNDFYQKALNGKADRFIWLNDHAYTSIIALRGNPGVKMIEKCVAKNATESMSCGDNNIKWPKNLGSGSPVASIRFFASGAVVTLRDGKEIEVTEEI